MQCQKFHPKFLHNQKPQLCAITWQSYHLLVPKKPVLKNPSRPSVLSKIKSHVERLAGRKLSGRRSYERLPRRTHAQQNLTCQSLTFAGNLQRNNKPSSGMRKRRNLLCAHIWILQQWGKNKKRAGRDSAFS